MHPGCVLTMALATKLRLKNVHVMCISFLGSAAQGKYHSLLCVIIKLWTRFNGLLQGEVAAGEAVDLQLRICVTGGRGGTADLLASAQVGPLQTFQQSWQCLL